MNRRTFLLAGAASAAAPGAGAPSKLRKHLSCGSIGVKASQRQAIDYAAQYGFDSVDADVRYLASLGETELAELLADMKAKNVAWALGGVPVDFRNDDSVFKESIRAFPAQAKAWQRAGVKRATTWISSASDDRTYLVNFRLHTVRLREIARILNDHQLRLGLEYVGPKTSWSSRKYPFIHTMAEMKELIAEIGQSNTGIVLDSWHWWNAGESDADILTLKGSDVVSVDLNDAPANVPRDQQVDNRRELPAATGVIDSAAFLKALVKIGFDGPVRAEPFNEALRAMPPDKVLEATMASLKKAFAAIG